MQLLAEYVRLYQQGNTSFQAHCDRFKQARQGLLKEKLNLENLEKTYKILNENITDLNKKLNKIGRAHV